MTTDAEAFFFLHDLITSYVKEKERVLSIQQGGGTSGFTGLNKSSSSQKDGNSSSSGGASKADKESQNGSTKSGSQNANATADPLQVISH